MTKKVIIPIIVLVMSVLVAGALWLWMFKPAEPLPVSSPNGTTPNSNQNQSPAASYKEYTSLKGIKIRLYEPISGATVTSPVKVRGEVPGSWSFEGSFPVKITGEQANALANAAAKLEGDWMTDDYVPFTATLTFNPGDTKTGFLILQKDNPSGLDAKDDSITVEVKF